jgi:hypothetical protein
MQEKAAKVNWRIKVEPLRQAFEAFKGEAFPEDSSDEYASELHAELAEFDGFVAGHIITLLGGGQLIPADFKPDDGLRTRLKALAASASTGSEDATSI